MNKLTLAEFSNDAKLRAAYALYEALNKTFRETYKRQPTCDVYIGFSSGKDSVVNARWDNKHQQRSDDAYRLQNLCSGIIDTVM